MGVRISVPEKQENKTLAAEKKNQVFLDDHLSNQQCN